MSDEETLRARFESELGEVLGADLKAHLERDAVVVVRGDVSLVECAIAVARDDAASVSAWLADGTLRRTTLHERVAWPEERSTRWRALVVRPFVLAQQLPSRLD